MTRRLSVSLGGVAFALASSLASANLALAQAQPRPAPTVAAPPARVTSPTKTDQGPAWATLKPAQQAALRPLERDWPEIELLQKRKWLEIAERFPAMPPQDQARLQTRMAEWAKLTPAARSQARLQFQEAKQIPTENRQASWQAYQALPPEQRRELADRAAPARSARPASQALGPAAPRPSTSTRDVPQAKANIVTVPATASPPKVVTPTVVQAQPGATTTLITRRPTPPAHQPMGMPKIAASPEYVDKTTLLPQAGPQSATARAIGASAPGQRP